MLGVNKSYVITWAWIIVYTRIVGLTGGFHSVRSLILQKLVYQSPRTIYHFYDEEKDMMLRIW